MWKEKYRIGVELIDGQHKELFHRVEEFVRALRNSEKWEDKQDKVKETMEFMEQYVVVHFDDEEAYQNKVNYPEANLHRQIHENFKAEVFNFSQRFEKEGYKEELVQQFAGKLMAWLINHVGAADQKIADYVKAHGGEEIEG